ncbi:hypothetical protein SAMN05444344_2962 [Tenacibaculum mesophilum]|uniref:RiboL-PSP-HEPN domain-containing protein n=1 Tax=Tenacibaculum mesophilum TaxID=104268 RepID=A0ABM7CEQ6_9FLAO|nr:hypothetical protein [Tenacibaculum mesophilum]AZJ32236.1 hypothetical protein D6200_06530 [Tenacibaculum mesophilum]QFS27492.1 hypothetical protein F9Y86_03390 [Tenacibaculum mesophilum]SHG16995.1 hypothetical protein SAMN05444344_2962 [Tenacibaculum mesophilum]
MTKEDLIRNAERIKKTSKDNAHGGLVEAREFLRIYAGEDSSFYKTLAQLKSGAYDSTKTSRVNGVLTTFIDFVNNDLLRSISLEREIQIDTVSDYLEQAEKLLNDKKVHPAAPAVIIGASLEEFLRNWLEDSGFDITTIKNSLDAYSTELKKQNKISKQDLKDIVSWSGTRNDAAHGHWESVEDRKRIKLMLESVNLFMRKYSE